MVVGTGVVDSIPTCIVRVEHDGIDILKIKDELKGSLIIDQILQQGEFFAYLKVKTPGPIQLIIGAEEEAWNKTKQPSKFAFIGWESGSSP